MPDISEDELEKLKQIASQRRGGKPIKYTELEAHRSAILKAMQRDIPLPVLLEWLRENRDVSVVLNTLRKYIVKKIGRGIYDEYLARNGWTRPSQPRRKASNRAGPASPAAEGSLPAVRIDLERSRPTTFQRTERK